MLRGCEWWTVDLQARAADRETVNIIASRWEELNSNADCEPSITSNYLIKTPNYTSLGIIEFLLHERLMRTRHFPRFSPK